MTVLPFKENSVLSAYFLCFGINERPIMDFYFSLLAPISKQGSETDNGEWIECF